jgi:hypothetical protein
MISLQFDAGIITNNEYFNILNKNILDWTGPSFFIKICFEPDLTGLKKISLKLSVIFGPGLGSFSQHFLDRLGQTLEKICRTGLRRKCIAVAGLN